MAEPCVLPGPHLWVFLGQALAADQSCRAAVARLIAHRVWQGIEPRSAESGAYCRARKRLPEWFFSAVARPWAGAGPQTRA